MTHSHPWQKSRSEIQSASLITSLSFVCCELANPRAMTFFTDDFVTETHHSHSTKEERKTKDVQQQWPKHVG